VEVWRQWRQKQNFFKYDLFPKVYRSPSTPPHNNIHFGKRREADASAREVALGSMYKLQDTHSFRLSIENHKKNKNHL
jgi:hypothetical protein